jgi:hypothetical protein
VACSAYQMSGGVGTGSPAPFGLIDTNLTVHVTTIMPEKYRLAICVDPEPGIVSPRDAPAKGC